MRTMRRLITTLLSAFTALAAGAAAAECAGNDLLARLAVSDRAAHDAIFERAHQSVNAQGRFWRIDQDGLPPSHLFGTYHDTEAAETLPPEVWEVLASARGAWFEISLEEQERMQNDMMSNPFEVIYDTSQEPLSRRVPASALPVLEAALEKRGIPLEAAEQMRGWMLFAILGFPACQFQAIQQGETVMDDDLARYALENGVPNHGLETYEQSLNALEAMSPGDLAGMMVDLGVSVPDDENIHATMQELYASGETMAIYEFGIWYSEQQGLNGARRRSDAFLESALTNRNRAWMDTILPALAEGNAFIGVGALHLPGENGVVELIREAGYEVTRVE